MFKDELLPHIVYLHYKNTELGAHSRVPGVLGTRALGNAIFYKARGNAEPEEVGTLISRA